MKRARPTEVNASALDLRRKNTTALRAVEKLECSTEFAERNFALSEYSDSTGLALHLAPHRH